MFLIDFQRGLVISYFQLKYFYGTDVVIYMLFLHITQILYTTLQSITKKYKNTLCVSDCIIKKKLYFNVFGLILWYDEINGRFSKKNIEWNLYPFICCYLPILYRQFTCKTTLK